LGRKHDTKEDLMKVFIEGASGVLGRQLVPLLVAEGHEVVAMTRSRERAADLHELGAEPVVADGLDRAAVTQVVERAGPEAVIHQMTGLSSVTSFANLDRELAPTNRLRTEGTDILLDAARAAGARRAIVQSYGLWSYPEAEGRLATEEDTPDPDPPATIADTVGAVRYVESTVPDADGIEGLALRYGLFYGPETGLSADGSVTDAVRQGQWPIVGDGAGAYSFIHVDDAATATLAALERGAPGIYNVVDDEPAPTAVWVAGLAEMLGAEPPDRVPEDVALSVAGDYPVYLSTRLNGLSNEKAKRELGWSPRYATWRDGFRSMLAGAPVGGRVT
jgi:nucleoside-diphosphate-sugar epimerase